MKKTRYSILLTIFLTSFIYAEPNVENNSQNFKYAGEKSFFDACIKLEDQKIDLFVQKMKQAYSRNIKSSGIDSKQRCKSITKDINIWGVELKASEYRMNGFYNFLIKQMKKQL